MKFSITLFFLLMLCKLSAQNEKVLESSQEISFLKPKWDIHLALGMGKHRETSLAWQGGINGRFKNHIYASVTYLSANEFTISIPEIFPTSGEYVGDNISNFSVVAGVHHSKKFFYSALGLGYGRAYGRFRESSTRTLERFQTNGLEIKAQASFVICKFLGLGFTYNYNVNAFKNFHFIMFGWHVGRLR